MTDEEWAYLGRRIESLTDELEALGWQVVVRWERPNRRVGIAILDRWPMPD